MSSSSREENEVEARKKSFADLFLELDVEGPFGNNKTPLDWRNPPRVVDDDDDNDDYFVDGHERRDCAPITPEHFNIRTNINTFFAIADLTPEDVLRYFKKIELSRRIEEYYKEGYRPGTRPSTFLPPHVRRLIFVCMSIRRGILYCRVDHHAACMEAFLSLRPPILFLFKVRFYGNDMLHHVNTLHLLLRHYGRKECLRFFNSCSAVIARAGDVELLEIMLEEGMTLNPRMIIQAVKGENIDVINLLVKGSSGTKALHVDDSIKWSTITPLACAVFKNNLSIVKQLIMYGANINRAPENNREARAIECAIYCGNEEIADYLLDCGASVDFEGSYDGTLLSWAREKNMSEKFISRLLSLGCADGERRGAAPPKSMYHYSREVNRLFYYEEYFEMHDEYTGEENYCEVLNAYDDEITPGDCTPEEERLRAGEEENLLLEEYGFLEEDEA